jgi:hypothetical protein
MPYRLELVPPQPSTSLTRTLSFAFPPPSLPRAQGVLHGELFGHLDARDAPRAQEAVPTAAGALSFLAITKIALVLEAALSHHHSRLGRIIKPSPESRARDSRLKCQGDHTCLRITERNLVFPRWRSASPPAAPRKAPPPVIPTSSRPYYAGPSQCSMSSWSCVCASMLHHIVHDKLSAHTEFTRNPSVKQA